MQPNIPPFIGLVAGRGALPRLLAEKLQQDAVPHIIYGVSGLSENVEVSIAQWLEPWQLAKTITTLQQDNVTRVVCAGAMQRPSLSTLALDSRAQAALRRIGLGIFGDNSLLSLLGRELARDGIALLGAHEILPSLITPLGLLAGKEPDKTLLAAAKLGRRFLDHISRFDVGQACVVAGGRIIALEGSEGTDALIKRCASSLKPADNAVLIKRSKRGQNKRLDLPTIGAQTLWHLAESRFAGVALESRYTLLIEPETCKKIARDNNVTLWGTR